MSESVALKNQMLTITDERAIGENRDPGVLILVYTQQCMQANVCLKTGE